MQWSLFNDVTIELLATADIVETLFSESQTASEINIPNLEGLSSVNDVFFQLRNADGDVIINEILASHAFRVMPFEIPLSESDKASSLLGNNVIQTLKVLEELPLRVLTKSIQSQNESEIVIMQIGVSLKRTHQSLAQFRFWLLIIIPLTIVLTVVGGVFLANRLLKPISEITVESREIGSENLDRRIIVENPDDELGQLAITLNALFDRLEKSFADQRRFIADASHELRTPLAAMWSEIEIVLRRHRSEIEYKSTLKSALEETKRLSHLTERLLLLAQSDSGHLPIHSTKFRLSDVSKVVIEKLEHVAASKGHTIKIEKNFSGNIEGDVELIEQVLMILVENAIKHMDSSGSIYLSCGECDDYVYLSVRDTGPGIPGDCIPFIFKRFYRVDHNRSREKGGAGLGLSIAKSIINAHGGQIHVTSSLGEGTIFKLNLPKSST